MPAASGIAPCDPATPYYALSQSEQNQYRQGPARMRYGQNEVPIGYRFDHPHQHQNSRHQLKNEDRPGFYNAMSQRGEGDDEHQPDSNSFVHQIAHFRNCGSKVIALLSRNHQTTPSPALD